MRGDDDPAPPLRGLRSAYADAAGHRLHYWLGGPDGGAPVLLWHGFLGTGWTWRSVAPALVEAGRRVLVVDMLGYGDSDKPRGTDGYDARSLAESIRGLAAGLDLCRAPLDLVAHDMGAPAALLWAADHPDEIARLVYLDEPVLLGDELRRIISYTPDAMAAGSMWWWILPLAPGVAQALVVGHERALLRWFYDGPAGDPQRFPDPVVDEFARTFAGDTGVLGAMGVYRAAFTTIAQTERLRGARITTPVVGVGGERGLGGEVARMLRLVARDVTEVIVPDCGHFVPEEAPDTVVRLVLDR